MRYYGGGIGHLNNAPLQQADPLPPDSSDEVAVPEGEETNTERDAARDGPTQDVIMRDEEPEVAEDDDDDGDDEASTDPENYDHSKHNDESEDEDSEGSTSSSDEEDSSGYASP